MEDKLPTELENINLDHEAMAKTTDLIIKKIKDNLELDEKELYYLAFFIIISSKIHGDFNLPMSETIKKADNYLKKNIPLGLNPTKEMIKEFTIKMFIVISKDQEENTVK